MPLILGTNSIKDTGYEAANSLRFNDDSSDSLSKSFGTPSSTTTWTISFWVKKCTNGSALNLSSQGVGTSNEDRIRFTSGDALEWSVYKSSYKGRLVTNRLFRDNSAWYNIVCVWDTTNGTAGDRMRIYINGVEETSFSTDTNPDQNETSNFNTSATNYIGSVGSGEFFDGYMTEVVFLDGTAVSNATSFGEFDSDSPNIWKPIDVSGLTFGNNGFHLDFENSGSLGADVSGNGNNFTVNNLTSIDQSTDTCTNNFATLNPLIPSSSITYSNGNITFTNSSSGHRSVASTFAVSSGKWYAEVKIVSLGSAYPTFGIFDSEDNFVSSTYFTETSSGLGYNSNGGIFSGGSYLVTGLPTWTTNDILGMALDVDNNKVYFSKNGTFVNSGDPANGTNGQSITSSKTWYFAGHTNDGGTDPVQDFNFGSPPYSISSGNADANGFGNFEYSVPSGYFSLCSKNLAEFG